MVREISAGGVLIRKRDGIWMMAAIEPAGDASSSGDSASSTGRSASRAAKSTRKPKGPVVALPKGLVDPGEKAVETALREVCEETGIVAEFIAKLGDTKYVYTRSWGDQQRVFKIVSFYLMRYRSGRINDIAPAMRIEVARAFWIPLQDAASMLAYKGEKQMAVLAEKYVLAHSEL
jgi:8-oxo-dGTP pyrophosphatase MutT (NUDIX family)